MFELLQISLWQLGYRLAESGREREGKAIILRNKRQGEQKTLCGNIYDRPLE